ncbi:TRAP transporter substrate-binding protein DctP [Treponema pectinovorum]|uniref:TRAP transporter substrate-binding protein DctP n=1 Tax=Treponema pectinovorum TaxID=164 RepID=UPI0011CAFBD6|nr:TRAP transporter substrate-binding protein DctP [Treponema pectinovorum]
MKNQLKRSFLLAIIVLILTGCSKKQVSVPEINLKVCDIHSEGYPTVVGLHEFSRLVKERSRGRINIEVIADGIEGGEEETLEMVKFGKIDFTRTSCALLPVIEPDFELLFVPGQYRDAIHFWKVIDGEIGSRMLKKLEQHSLYGLCYYDSGARSFYSNDKISSFSNLKGLKIRTQASVPMLEFINALEAKPVPMDLREVESAFRSHKIDAAENNIPSYEATGQYKVAKYYFKDEHSRIPDILVGSKKSLAALTQSDINLIFEAAQDSGAVQKMAWLEYEKTALEKVVAEGSIITTPKLDDRLKILQKIRPLIYKHFTERQLEILNEIQNTN